MFRCLSSMSRIADRGPRPQLPANRDARQSPGGRSRRLDARGGRPQAAPPEAAGRLDRLGSTSAVRTTSGAAGAWTGSILRRLRARRSAEASRSDAVDAQGASGCASTALDKGETIVARPQPEVVEWARDDDLQRLVCVQRLDLGELVVASRPRDRSRAVRVLGDLRTRTGRRRGDRVRQCGAPQYVLTSAGEICVAHTSCRDRACPRCARTRADEYRADLANALRTRWADSDCGDLVFVTLTQPKQRLEDRDLRSAIDLVLRRWRILTTKRYALGRQFLARVRGGVRAVEVTLSSGRPGLGWHVHIHAVLELERGQDPREFGAWLRAAWADLVEGAVAAQDVQPLTRGDASVVTELAKYVTKPFSLDEDWAMREAFEALVGRRLIDAVGTWRGYRSWPRVEVAQDDGIYRPMDVAVVAVGPRMRDLAWQISAGVGDVIFSASGGYGVTVAEFGLREFVRALSGGQIRTYSAACAAARGDPVERRGLFEDEIRGGLDNDSTPDPPTSSVGSVDLGSRRVV